jgi:hypothetical protein
MGPKLLIFIEPSDYESDALTPSSPDESGCAGQATELWAQIQGTNLIGFI